MNLIIGIILGLLCLSVLVIIHELGHAIVASRNGIAVEEFGIGFPPKIFGKKLKNGVFFTINVLPLGGFVRLKGESDSSKLKNSYGSATTFQKVKVMLAGVVSNWIFAVIILSVVAAIGMPKIFDNQFSVSGDTKKVFGQVTIASVLTNSPAKKNGFQSGDVLEKINNQLILNDQQFIKLTRANSGKTVDIQYKRSGKNYNKTITLGSDLSKGIFGASIGQSERYKSTWSSPIVGFTMACQLTGATFQGLGSLIYNLGSGFFNFVIGGTKSANSNFSYVGDSVSGPVGILGVLFPQVANEGTGQILFLMAVISISLAVMNILPIPALDGGRLLVTLLYKIRKKILTEEKEEKIQAYGFLAIIVLSILVTVSDVCKLFK